MSEPVQFLVTGRHKSGGMKGQSCSFNVYAPKSWSVSQILEKARADNPWADPMDCRRVAIAQPPAPTLVCWEYQAGRLPIRLSFPIKCI